jgi:3-oxoacyl-[acyl-carrier-protein] synthase-1
MMSAPRLYIAGMGMITPLGPSVATTVAAVNAGISAYALSEYDTDDGEPITMARVPDVVFTHIDAEIDEGDRHNLRHNRLMKMAITAIREACETQLTEQAVPIVFGMSERFTDRDGLSSFIENLQQNCKPWISTQLSRSLHSGRAAGMEAIDFIFRYLYESKNSFLLVGASDSYMDDDLINPLAQERRLLSPGASDAFVPGEAASFLLLTRYPELAEQRNGYAIALHTPGMATEEGHLYSDAPYRGDGLDQAFKKALQNQPQHSIQNIYSSMNGENHWAKEYGVAYLRNKKTFVDKINIVHPADCYGDIGAATATALITLAAEHLHRSQQLQKSLVYSSSDFGLRAAIMVEKIRLTNEAELKV